jgi:ComEC/Rec2-related protein
MMMWWAVFFVSGLLNPRQSIAIPAFALVVAMCAWHLRFPRGCHWMSSRALLVMASGLVLYSGAGLLVRGNGHREERPVDCPPVERLCGPVRQRLRDSLDDPRLSDESSLLLDALLLGSRKGLGYEIREAYSYLGISHFLALSGLHLGIVLLPLSRILCFVPLDRRIRYAVLFAFVLCYAAIARFPASLVRASALTGSFLLMRGLGRRTTMLRALVTGCLAVTCLRPRIVLDAGFQLSFAAVCGIVLIAVPTLDRCKRILPSNRIGVALKVVMAPVIVTVAINMATMPLILRLFDRATLLAPLFNLAMIVPVTALLYLGLAYLVIPIYSFGDLICPLINTLASFLWDFPLRFSRSPHPALIAGDVRLVPYVIGLFLLVYALRRRGSGRAYACIASVILISAALLPIDRRAGNVGFTDAAMERLTEDCTLASCGTAVLLIDGHLSRFEASRVVRLLWGRGLSGVDVLVLCTPRSRNAGGIEYLLSRISIRRAILNPFLLTGGRYALEILRARDVAVDTLLHDRSLELGSRALILRAPPYPPSETQPVMMEEAYIRCVLERGNGAGEKAN